MIHSSSAPSMPTTPSEPPPPPVLLLQVPPTGHDLNQAPAELLTPTHTSSSVLNQPPTQSGQPPTQSPTGHDVNQAPAELPTETDTSSWVSNWVLNQNPTQFPVRVEQPAPLTAAHTSSSVLNHSHTQSLVQVEQLASTRSPTGHDVNQAPAELPTAIHTPSWVSNWVLNQHPTQFPVQVEQPAPTPALTLAEAQGPDSYPTSTYSPTQTPCPSYSQDTVSGRGRASGRKRTAKACDCCGLHGRGHHDASLHVKAPGRGRGGARGRGRGRGRGRSRGRGRGRKGGRGRGTLPKTGWNLEATAKKRGRPKKRENFEMMDDHDGDDHEVNKPLKTLAELARAALNQSEMFVDAPITTVKTPGRGRGRGGRGGRGHEVNKPIKTLAELARAALNQSGMFVDAPIATVKTRGRGRGRGRRGGRGHEVNRPIKTLAVLARAALNQSGRGRGRRGGRGHPRCPRTMATRSEQSSSHEVNKPIKTLVELARAALKQSETRRNLGATPKKRGRKIKPMKTLVELARAALKQSETRRNLGATPKKKAGRPRKRNNFVMYDTDEDDDDHEVNKRMKTLAELARAALNQSGIFVDASIATVRKGRGRGRGKRTLPETGRNLEGTPRKRGRPRRGQEVKPMKTLAELARAALIQSGIFKPIKTLAELARAALIQSRIFVDASIATSRPKRKQAVGMGGGARNWGEIDWGDIEVKVRSPRRRVRGRGARGAAVNSRGGRRGRGVVGVRGRGRRGRGRPATASLGVGVRGQGGVGLGLNVHSVRWRGGAGLRGHGVRVRGGVGLRGQGVISRGAVGFGLRGQGVGFRGSVRFGVRGPPYVKGRGSGRVGARGRGVKGRGRVGARGRGVKGRGRVGARGRGAKGRGSVGVGTRGRGVKGGGSVEVGAKGRGVKGRGSVGVALRGQEVGGSLRGIGVRRRGSAGVDVRGQGVRCRGSIRVGVWGRGRQERVGWRERFFMSSNLAGQNRSGSAAPSETPTSEDECVDMDVEDSASCSSPPGNGVVTGVGETVSELACGDGLSGSGQVTGSTSTSESPKEPDTAMQIDSQSPNNKTLPVPLSNGNASTLTDEHCRPSPTENRAFFPDIVSPPSKDCIVVHTTQHSWALRDHRLYCLPGTWKKENEEMQGKEPDRQQTEKQTDGQSQEKDDADTELLTEMIHDFLESFYTKYGSFIPLSETDVVEHLKKTGNSDLSNRKLNIPAEVSRYRAGLASAPVGGFMVTYNKHTLSLEDLGTLEEQNWINDQIINMYGELIMEETQHKVHFFNSFFHRQLVAKGYEGVKRWTKKEDLFSKQLLLVPIHLEIHWSLIAVDIGTKTIGYYDSQGIVFKHTIDNIMKYIQAEAKQKEQTDFQKGWKMVIIKGIPQQKNDSDCGVFVLEYCRCLSVKQPLRFSQEDMPRIRKRLYKELCECRFID